MAAVAVGIIATVAFWPGTDDPGDGPLSAGTASLVTGMRPAVGDEVSIGHTLLLNYGDQPAVIEQVRLLGVTDGLELLGVFTRPVPDEHDQGMFLGEFGFPPPKWPSKPLAEQNVVPVPTTFSETGDPAEGLELVIGVRATRPGVARARAVEFTYRVGDRRYREEYQGSIYLCAPGERYQGDACPGDAEGVFSDEVAG